MIVTLLLNKKMFTKELYGGGVMPILLLFSLSSIQYVEAYINSSSSGLLTFIPTKKTNNKSKNNNFLKSMQLSSFIYISQTHFLVI